MDTPDQIINKLNTYTDKFYSVLDDFSNSYINYKMYPEYNEHSNIYANNKAIIESLQADVFIATNDVQQNIDTLNGLIDKLNAKSQITSSGNGSDLLIGESTDLYKMQRLSNIALAIGIFLILLILFKVYSAPKQTQSQIAV